MTVPRRRVSAYLEEEHKRVFDDILFDLNMSEADAVRLAILEYLPKLENMAKIINSRKRPRVE